LPVEAPTKRPGIHSTSQSFEEITMTCNLAQSNEIGIPWIREGDYRQFKEMLGRDLPLQYADWRRYATSMITRVERQGIPVRKIDIAPATFLQWCSRHNRRVCRIAMQRYADEHIDMERRHRVPQSCRAMRSSALESSRG
jgi:hypothetical protein